MGVGRPGFQMTGVLLSCIVPLLCSIYRHGRDGPGAPGKIVAPPWKNTRKVHYIFISCHVNLGRCENPECRNITEYAGIWRNITEYAGISRNMAEYHGIWRNITEYHDIFPEYTWTSRYFSMVDVYVYKQSHG